MVADVGLDGESLRAGRSEGYLQLVDLACDNVLHMA